MMTVMKHLESFNRKERFFLIGEALGNRGFQLSTDFRSRLGEAFGIEPPSSAFVATDYLCETSYRALTPDDLFDIAARHGLAYDHARQTGVVFHMMSAIGECGRLGLTAVADSPEDADALYKKAVATLDSEAELALEVGPLPPV